MALGASVSLSSGYHPSPLQLSGVSIHWRVSLHGVPGVSAAPCSNPRRGRSLLHLFGLTSATAGPPGERYMQLFFALPSRRRGRQIGARRSRDGRTSLSGKVAVQKIAPGCAAISSWTMVCFSPSTQPTRISWVEREKVHVGGGG